MNTLRLRTTGDIILAETRIATGSARGARRVPRGFAEFAVTHPDARLEVWTARGWKPRRIVTVNGTYYTREAR